MPVVPTIIIIIIVVVMGSRPIVHCIYSSEFPRKLINLDAPKPILLAAA